MSIAVNGLLVLLMLGVSAIAVESLVLEAVEIDGGNILK